MMIKKTARFITLSALFVVPFFSFIVANGYFFPFITGKAFFFRILVEVAFAAWVVLACAEPRYRPRLNALTIGIAAFAAITLAADLLGVLPLRSIWSNFERMEGWLTIIHLFAFFLVLANVFGAEDDGRRLWHRWLNVELAAASLVGIYGFFQLFGWAAIHQGSTRIDASIGNAAYMAVYMLWNAGIAAYLWTIARARNTASKGADARVQVWAYPILVVLFSFLLFETATRGTILGWTGGIALGLAVYALAGRGEPKKLRYAAGGIVIAMAILAGSFWALRTQPFIQNNGVLGRLADISLTNTETTARLYIWQMAWNGGLERPVLGWGQENFNYIFNAEYNPKLWSQEQWFDRAHSVYLDWFVASGFLGLAAYLALYALFLVGVWRSGLTVGQKSILSGLLAGYAVHNIFVFDNLASYLPFFAMLAFVASMRKSQPAAALGSKPVSSEAVEYVAAPAAIVALVVALYFLNVRPIQANTGLIAALRACGSDPAAFQAALDVHAYVANQEIREQLLSCASSAIQSQIPTSAKQEYYKLALKGIDDQIAATGGKDARIYALAGTFMDAVATPDMAQKYLEKAHELSPKKQSITTPLAVSYINSNKADEAARIIASAYADAPDNSQVRLTYAIALIADNKEAEAHKIFGNDPSIFQSRQVAEAYMFEKQYGKAIAIFERMNAADPTNMDAVRELVQALYAAGRKSEVVSVLRATEKVVEKDHPEYIDGIESLIKQVQAGQ